ncbi:membrane protein [Legionella norrlandica]|uniref:Membrane protein n=1 Tax=Legionella norrlandica TaxID=1498499 RepID=A0A0A2SSH9_9GAMM|nr:ABC transporter permease [Legionella norrlandica]KGP62686.1 membrane protein [Legionella norrlandica]
MNIRFLKALVIKESLQIIRDPSTILIAFVLPLILLFIFGYGVNLDTDRIKFGLVLENYDSTSNSLSQSFNNSRFLDVHNSTNRQKFSQGLVNGTIRGMVDVPQRLTANIVNGDPMPSLQTIVDGSTPQVASFAENYALGVLQNWLNSEAFERGQTTTRSGINIEPRYWYNQELKSRAFLIPGSIVIVMTLIGTLLTSLVIAREWERGTMEAMMATPISIVEIILGKLIPYFVLGMGSMFLCTIVATFYYGVPFQGNILALTLVSAVFLVAALGQGLLISTLAKDQFVASQLALMSAFLPAFILSGFIFEIYSMPKPIQWLTHLFAARYFVTSLQTLFLTGTIWSLLIRCLLAIALIGFVFFLITAHKTRKRLD